MPRNGHEGPAHAICARGARGDVPKPEVGFARLACRCPRVGKRKAAASGKPYNLEMVEWETL